MAAEMGDLYLPGAASLLEQLDTRVMIILSDGRHLVGLLRSFDQFLNLVLENTSERILLPGEVLLESHEISHISIFCFSLSSREIL
jgi:small nuclear ribonucleoprotein (snRNP)-like protein